MPRHGDAKTVPIYGVGAPLARARAREQAPVRAKK